jgi:hypothetical protein
MHFRSLHNFRRILNQKSKSWKLENTGTVAGQVLAQGHSLLAQPNGLGGPRHQRGAWSPRPQPRRWRGPRSLAGDPRVVRPVVREPRMEGAPAGQLGGRWGSPWRCGTCVGADGGDAVVLGDGGEAPVADDDGGGAKQHRGVTRKVRRHRIRGGGS